jgi:hypothetical protein
MALRFVLVFLLVLVFACPLSRGVDCLSFDEARAHIGESKCITGKVVRVESRSGAHFLDFCDDYRVCSFTGVVFARDLRQVGDVRQLAGRTVELHGTIKEYDGRAEIVISRPSQLGADGGRIPPMPKGFDVENKGRYSAGKFSYPSSLSKPKRKRDSKAAELQGRIDAETD